MYKVFEFRIRLEDDDRRWEDIPVHEEVEFAGAVGAATHALADLKLPDPNVKEVRYNEKGSLQGRYM